MTLTFYYAPMSSATPVHWAIEELGVPYEGVVMNLESGEQKKPEYLQLNPNGKVPLLVHDGTPIFESLAIMLYLGEAFGVERKLYPPPGAGRADALKWMCWNQVSVGEALSRLLHSSSPRIPAERHNEKAAAAAREDIDRHLAVLDAHLADRSHVLGESFSLADVQMSSWCEYLRMVGVDPSGHERIAAWLSRCADRPARGRAYGAAG